jgi:hypothetical protein
MVSAVPLILHPDTDSAEEEDCQDGLSRSGREST